MSDYGTMRDRIADDLDRSDGSANSIITREIQSAIAHYNREKFWFQEGQATAVTVAGTDTYAIPTDYRDGLRMEITVNGGTYPLIRRSIDYLDTISVSSSYRGQPSDYAMFASQFRLYPIPDAVYTLTLSYWKSLPTLSELSDTNAWMTEGEELIRSRAERKVAQIIGYPEKVMECKESEAEALHSLRLQTSKMAATGNVMPAYL